MKPNDTPRRILVVNANWFGDALFSTPALRALKKRNPTAHIACLAPPRVIPVLERNPHIDELIAYDDRVSFLNPAEFLRVVSVLRRGHFDCAVLLHRSKTKALLATMAGIPERIGYATPGRGRMLTRTVEWPLQPAHKIDLYLHLLERSGTPADGRHMEFVPDLAAQATLDRLRDEEGISEGEPYAVVHAGGNWELKRWPVRYFIETIRAIVKEFGCKVVLCGTESERAATADIRSHFAGVEVVSLCGKTSVDELALLLKDARFLLSNDSGPIHLAAALGTKIIGVFGPTSPALTGPVSLAPSRILWKDVGCVVPCYFRTCSYRVCMDWVRPDEVLNAARELLHAG